jgi:hypothetical protein
MVEHLLHCSGNPVAVSLNLLSSLLVWSLLSIKDKDWIYWQPKQVAAAHKQCCQLGALDIAIMVAYSINPTTGYLTLVCHYHNSPIQLPSINSYLVSLDPSYIVNKPLFNSEVAQRHQIGYRSKKLMMHTKCQHWTALDHMKVHTGHSPLIPTSLCAQVMVVYKR